MNKLTWIIIAVLVLIIAYLYFFTGTTSQPDTFIVHDTTTITRYEKQLSKDTVIKWYERLVTKESRPTVIYQQKIDSIFIASKDDYDLILGIDKRGTDLRVFALNKKSQLLKEEIFHNVYQNFTAFSATDKVVVKSDLFYFNGVKAGYEHSRSINDLKSYTHSIDLMTGVSFIDRYSLDAGVEYDMTGKDIKLKAKVTARIF